MKTRTLTVTLWTASTVLALIAAGVFVVLGARGIGAVPMSSAPISGDESGQSAPDARSTPSPVIASPTPASTDAPATSAPAASEAPPPAPLTDIDGIPIHITITHDGQPIVDADVNQVQLDDNGWLNPDAGLAGWYTQWGPVPGNVSQERSIIAGHDINAWGGKDVFYNLGLTKRGDHIVITYRNETGALSTADFQVDQDARTAPKDDVIRLAASTYRWIWNSDQPERVVSIFSCDVNAPTENGHSLDNWVVQATRVA